VAGADDLDSLFTALGFAQLHVRLEDQAQRASELGIVVRQKQLVRSGPLGDH
jgi:hypothetical protein